MNVEYYFKDTIISKLIEYNLIIRNSPSLEIVKGLLFPDIVIINLEAKQWKELPENYLIEELNKTITHEHIHFLIKENIKKGFTKTGEESVCAIMANQFNPINFVDSCREEF